MRIKDAVSNINKKHPDTPLLPLYTPWGEAVRDGDTDKLLQEYPRPQLERDHYRILNGRWSCWFTPMSERGAASEKQEILVPFSPEALLSGVCRQLQPDEYLWYEKQIAFSEEDHAFKIGRASCRERV